MAVPGLAEQGSRLFAREAARIPSEEIKDERLVRGNGARCSVADIATRTRDPFLSTGACARVAEGLQQNLPAASAVFREFDQDACPSPRRFPHTLDPLSVLRAPEQHGIGPDAVPSPAACFLHIGLGRRRGIPMDNRSHVLFVHAHSPGAGRAKYPPRVSVKPSLDRDLLFLREARVVKADVGISGKLAKDQGGAFGSPARGTEHHQRALAPQDLPQKGRFLRPAAMNPVDDIRPVGIAPHQVGPPPEENLGDARQNRRRGRRGKGRYGRGGECFQYLTKGTVGGAETVSPFGDTVGLVDRHVDDSPRGKALHETLSREYLGVCYDEPRRWLAVPPLEPGVAGLANLSVLLAPEDDRIQASLPHASFLVPHEGEQGIDHEGRAPEKEGRQLKAQGFARSRRQEDDLPPAVDSILVKELVIRFSPGFP